MIRGQRISCRHCTWIELRLQVVEEDAEQALQATIIQQFLAGILKDPKKCNKFFTELQ